MVYFYLYLAETNVDFFSSSIWYEGPWRWDFLPVVSIMTVFGDKLSYYT